MIRAIPFDGDGTLANSVATSPERFFAAAAMRGLPVTREILAQKGIIPRIGGKAISKFWPGENVDAFFRQWEELDILFNFEPIPGARAALEILRSRHYQMSVLSNRNNRTLDPLMKKLGLEHLFWPIYGTEGRKFMKPDPRSAGPLLKIFAEKLGISREEALFVGDSAEDDWPVARDNGMIFLGVLTGVSAREEFLAGGVGAENIIASVADLPAWLEKYDR